MSALKCSDIRSDISLYGDGCLDSAFEDALQEHLTICPICRQELFEYREMRAALRSLPRTKIDVELRAELKDKALSAARPAMFSFPRLSGFAWRQNILPLIGSSFASILVGFALFSYMLSGVLGENSSIAANAPLLPAGTFGTAPDRDSVSAADFARQRLAYSAESPSINPQGALAAMTKGLSGTGLKNDEMVVVARVFGNGLAEITDVVEPASDPQAVQALEHALEDRRSSTPFVPAKFDGRSNDVKVVLKIQNVVVSTRRNSRN
ncbi:MAG TPA: zf-HC2 domain-containing protein [Pyrinomonadaceae bacterium]|nr:zf-HC2 domain-containing protein [Pyrinomonadaceae bacterium]